MGNDLTPQEQLAALFDLFQTRRDMTVCAVDGLKNVLQLNGLDYEKIISGQEELKDIEIGIEAGTILDLIATLQNAHIQMERDRRMIAMLEDTEYGQREFDNIAHERIKLADRWKKDKAYRAVARWKGWTEGKRSVDHDLFDEYMTLIGRGSIGAKQATNKQKLKIIEFLTKKYNLVSMDATISRLKRARSYHISKLKSKNKDFSHLEKILPMRWDSGKQETMFPDEGFQRKSDCRLYERCYSNAAHSNTSLDCSKCKKYKPISF